VTSSGSSPSAELCRWPRAATTPPRDVEGDPNRVRETFDVRVDHHSLDLRVAELSEERIDPVSSRVIEQVGGQEHPDGARPTT